MWKSLTPTRDLREKYVQLQHIFIDLIKDKFNLTVSFCLNIM
jgi:hypothetical protein